MADPLHKQMHDDVFYEVAFPTCMKAKVSTNAQGLSDPVYVTVPYFDGGQSEFGPCPWTPRPLPDGTVDMPNKGDHALIVLDEEDDAWIITWWPYELFEEAPLFEGDSALDPSAAGTTVDTGIPADTGSAGP